MTKQTLIVACHIDDLDDARNYAVCRGWLAGSDPAAWWGTFSASYRDDQGLEWRVLCTTVSPEFIAAAVDPSPIERPEEDTENDINLTGARRAQAKTVFWQLTEPEQPVPQADPSRIIAITDMTGPDALKAMGLVSPPMGS